MLDYSDSFSNLNIIEEPSKITETIYQGGYQSAKDKDKMKDLGITHIVTAGKFLSKDFPKDFKYYSMEVNDFSTENIEKYFEDVCDFIEECISNGGKVLIHCAAGISRSTTVTCAYLIKKMKISFDEALKIVKKGRSIASPNYGFQEQLKKWELNQQFNNVDDKNNVNLNVNDNVEDKFSELELELGNNPFGNFNEKSKNSENKDNKQIVEEEIVNK